VARMSHGHLDIKGELARHHCGREKPPVSISGVTARVEFHPFSFPQGRPIRRLGLPPRQTVAPRHLCHWRSVAELRRLPPASRSSAPQPPGPGSPV
jgi:hypothetical protein